MAKQPQPASSDAPQPNVGAHPLAEQISTGERLMESMAKRKQAAEFKVEDLKAWGLAVNSMAASDQGRIVLRGMLDHSGLMTPRGTSAQQMIVDKMKAEFYLSYIRPFLTPELRKELE